MFSMLAPINPLILEQSAKLVALSSRFQSSICSAGSLVGMTVGVLASRSGDYRVAAESLVLKISHGQYVVLARVGALRIIESRSS